MTVLFVVMVVVVMSWTHCRIRIRNALQKVCLAGGHLATQLASALSAMDSCSCDNFVILMANVESQTYRALYALDGTSGEVRSFATRAVVS